LETLAREAASNDDRTAAEARVVYEECKSRAKGADVTRTHSEWARSDKTDPYNWNDLGYERRSNLLSAQNKRLEVGKGNMESAGGAGPLIIQANGFCRLIG
jgi:hypothetical protein